MQMPQHIIEKLSDMIITKFKPIYEEYIQHKREIEPEEYFDNVTVDIYEELENLMEITNETLLPVTKRRQSTKSRWIKKEFEENYNGGFNEEINHIAKFLYDSVKDKDIEKFRIFYEVDSFEELKDKKINELNDWAKDDDLLLCEYPYLKYKKWNQIELAMLNDIQYVIIKTAKEECPLGEQNDIVSVPNSITDFPYDHTNRVKINSANLIDGKYFQAVYVIDDKTKFDSRLKVEALEEGLMAENLKMLNLLDRDILVYLMSLKHEALYQPVPMVVEIGDIVRNVYHNDSVKSYNAVKESLIKMDYMENRVIDESSLRTTKSEIFYSVKIEVDEVTKKEVARIIFSEDLINDFVKNQTVSIYKQIIDRFTLNASKVLIYALQRQRILCASQSEDGDSLFFNTNLNFFRGALVFSTRRRAQQIKLIEKSLDEIVDNRITLKSYKRKGDNFLLEFYPFTDKEKRDLLHNKAPEKFLMQRTVDNQKDDIKQLKMDLSS